MIYFKSNDLSTAFPLVVISGGKMNGVLTTPCLFNMVETRSENGKMILNRRKEQFEVKITFTLMAIDELTNDGVSSLFFAAVKHLYTRNCLAVSPLG